MSNARGDRVLDVIVVRRAGVLLRPDGHTGWVGPDDSTESAASLLQALAGWLDAMPTTWFGSGADCQSGGLPSMT